jgi:predicted RNA polymerase sigma factor
VVVAEGVLARVVREEGPRVLASLVRATGSLQVAEDAVNRAVALSERDGPATGLAALDAIAGTGGGRGLDGFPPYHGARGQLLLGLGRHRDAAAELRRALAGPVPAAVKRHLHQQLERCSIASTTPNHHAANPSEPA